MDRRYNESDRGMAVAPVNRSLSLGHRPAFLIRDSDGSYGEVFTRRLRAMDIRDRPTAPRSPWQNCYVERMIGSIRRKCLDHMIVLGEVHLRRVLSG
jgi:hypothetical protein